MTNKEFQDILKKYPDDLPVYIDTGHGWNAPDNKNYRDPAVSVQNDEGGYPWGLELWAGEYPAMDEETISKIEMCACTPYCTDDAGEILKRFNEKYE